MGRWVVVAAVLLAALHYAALLLTTSSAAFYAGPLAVYAAIRLFQRVRGALRPSSMQTALREIILLLLLLTTVADLLYNVIPYEPHADVRKDYRSLQIFILYMVPFLVVYTPWRWRPTLLRFGLIMQMIPPYSYTMAVAFNTPVYGRVTVLLYLLVLLPRVRRLPFSRADFRTALVLILTALPAVLLGHSSANAVDHVVQLSLFMLGGVVVTATGRRTAMRDRLLAAVVSGAAVHLLFVLWQPGLHSVNSNITALLLEWVLLIGMYLLGRVVTHPILLLSARGLVLIVILAADFRMDAKTGFLAALFAVASWAMFSFAAPRVTRRLLFRTATLALVAAVVTATAYMAVLGTMHTAQARHLLWQVTLSGISESWVTALFGTGDFGPFHFFLFRHLDHWPTAAELEIIAAEPKLLAEHPHNDYLLLAYGGGILFAGAYLVFLMSVLNAVFRKPVDLFRLSLAGALFAFALHAVNEPATGAVMSGFLFWMTAGWILKRDDAERPLGVRQASARWLSGLVPLLGVVAVWLTAGELLQVPVTGFWRSNSDLISVLRHPAERGPSVDVLSASRREALSRRLPALADGLHLLQKLEPFETDLLRQEGDVHRLMALLAPEDRVRSDHLVRAEACYCRAFTLRSSPLHFQGIVRVRAERGLPLDQACADSAEAPSHLREYDRFGLLEARPL